MRLELARPKQDPNALAAQRVHAFLEWRPPSECGVYEWQGHDADTEAWRFGEDAESVCVADPVGPLVDRVVSRGGDDDRVGVRGLGFAGAAVLAAHCSAGLGFELGYVDERQCRWGGDDLDGPATVVGEFDEPSDVACGPCPAHDQVENSARG